jgi:hypothetical protein
MQCSAKLISQGITLVDAPKIVVSGAPRCPLPDASGVSDGVWRSSRLTYAAMILARRIKKEKAVPSNSMLNFGLIERMGKMVMFAFLGHPVRHRARPLLSSAVRMESLPAIQQRKACECVTQQSTFDEAASNSKLLSLIDGRSI